MAAVTLRADEPVKTGVCVFCGGDRAPPREVSLRRTPLLALLSILVAGIWGLLLVALVSRKRKHVLPFHEACHERWSKGGLLAAFTGLIAVTMPMAGFVAASLAGDTGWIARGFGTAVVLLGFPAFFLLAPGWRGPRVVSMTDEETVLDLPSEAAAEAILASGKGGVRLLSRTLGPDSVCMAHPERAATFACATCGAPGCPDCEFRRGGAILCAKCLGAGA